MSWRDFDHYPKSTPRKVTGGIKATGGRALGGERWWAKRWISVLEGFSLGARLTRGRAYARHGQVVSITIAPGVVTAKVQGSRATPYKVTVSLSPLPPATWDRVIDELTGRVLFLAKLLAGEMPAEIEEAFQAAGAPLFPTSVNDLDTDCSCPDWSNPCKHIAAVYYLLGEEFDRDPFLIFTLRGLPREALLARLHDAGAEAAPANAPLPPAPLSPEPERFWTAALPTDLSDATLPAVDASLLRRLGPFPFWRGEASLLDGLTPLYTDATRRMREALVEAAEERDDGAIDQG
jgi:uncharacterized Zn finger protein